MRKHIGVVAGSVIAGVGLLLAVVAFSGFSIGLPAVQAASGFGLSWFMIAVVLMLLGAFVALAARGLEAQAEEHRHVEVRTSTRPVRHLHLVR